MRIVAGDAAHARIGAVEAFTVGQTVRLEADVGDPAGTLHRNAFPRAVALAAEIAHLLGSKLTGALPE